MNNQIEILEAIDKEPLPKKHFNQNIELINPFFKTPNDCSLICFNYYQFFL